MNEDLDQFMKIFFKVFIVMVLYSLAQLGLVFLGLGYGWDHPGTTSSGLSVFIGGLFQFVNYVINFPVKFIPLGQTNIFVTLIVWTLLIFLIDKFFKYFSRN